MQLHRSAYRLTLLGLLSALSIALSAFEGTFAAFMPLGTRPGLANVAVLFAASSLGVPAALTVALIKAVFALLTRGSVAFAMSLAGGLLSALFTALAFRLLSEKMGAVGIAVAAALLHNLGQLAVALCLFGTAVFSYAPILLLLALPCGILTGTIFRFASPLLQKNFRHINDAK